MENIFNKIDHIAWNDIDASNVPALLRDLASNDIEKQLRAYEILDSIYITADSESWENYGSTSVTLKTDAPVFIVPILIELITSESVNEKSIILQLLCDLSTIGYLNRNKLSSPYSDRAERVYKAAQAGIKVYESLTASDNTTLADLAKGLLTFFRDTD